MIILLSMDLILISGLSGSGKSVALNMLEDGGYYCVDNLPVSLLQTLIDELRKTGNDKVALAVDVRNSGGLSRLPREVEALREKSDLSLRLLFLDAQNETLIKRFSETRRTHPLAVDGASLEDAICQERHLLEPIATLGYRIDTSDLKANALREWVRQFAGVDHGRDLLVVFQSFGFKHGLPLDADLVFDVRCLPNPHYDPALRPLTGRDAPVIAFLEERAEVQKMGNDIRHFLTAWLPSYVADGRHVLTVSIGCTGGQHRSVYLAEWLGRNFAGHNRVLVRHRSLV